MAMAMTTRGNSDGDANGGGEGAIGFGSRLAARVRAVGNSVCVGIDPRWENLPASIRSRAEPTVAGAAGAFLEYAIGVLEAVADRAAVVKFQSAFFEAYGPAGISALDVASRRASELGLLSIFDGKRNDIGSTAEAYAAAYLGESAVAPGVSEPAWKFDAITVNPWLGADGIEPFRARALKFSKGLFVLARTSNPSASQFQELIADGRPIYRHVADRLAEWNRGTIDESGYGAVGAVVGATTPRQLAELRAALPGVWFLVPGYGAQGGAASDIAAAFDARGLGALVNSSRGIGFAYERADLRERFGDDWRGAVRFALDETVEDLASHTPAAALRR